MPENSPGAVLRQLQLAQSLMKKARQALALARQSPTDPQALLRVGWDSLQKTFVILGQIPLSAATEPVLTKQLAVQRYATALLVRLRRIARNEPGALDDIEDDE